MGTATGNAARAWAAKPPAHFPDYAAGSDGPNAVDLLLQRDGRAWRPVGAQDRQG